ncbi:MAG: HAD-IA family hydrolase [Thiotrichales bacterium]|jgi:phosphoglycolate phosphatase|nr:HAD-IA family hydrolase [Thiotrichales bacterium]
MKPYRAIIFDWDGTLMDSDRRIVDCLKAAAVRADLPLLADQAYRDIIGLSLPVALATLYPQATEWQHKVLDAVYRWQFMEANTTLMQPFEGMHDLLKDLRSAGYLLAIATGKSRHGLELVLAETGTTDYFDITKSGEETACKPNPLMLQQIIDAFGIAVNQALMVGDSVFDLEMAQAIGMPAVAMTHGVHGVEALSVFNPVRFCDSLPQLRQWLLAE